MSADEAQQKAMRLKAEALRVYGKDQINDPRFILQRYKGEMVYRLERQTPSKNRK